MEWIDEERKEVDAFIEKVFYCFDGNINIFNNKASLEINWAPMYGSSIAAYSTNPNRITIYPRVLYSFFPDKSMFEYNVILSIIHELYHTDQIIDYDLMTKDSIYNKQIEHVVEFESHLYMCNNREYIKQAIGFDDPIPFEVYADYIPQYETGLLYQRRDYISHFIGMMQEMTHTHTSDLIDALRSSFMSSMDIVMIINGSMIDIKRNNVCCPLQQLNSIMTENYYKFNYRRAFVKYFVDTPSNTMYLNIVCDGKNKMFI